MPVQTPKLRTPERLNDVASHADLLTVARALRRSAEHEFSRLRETTARVVHQGQQRILSLLDDLLSSGEDDDGSCYCVVRAAEVDSMLRRQAKLEAAVARSQPLGDGDVRVLTGVGTFASIAPQVPGACMGSA